MKVINGELMVEWGCQISHKSSFFFFFFYIFFRSILKKGGSAVDGAIAALLCTSVVNPQSMGIGGGSIVTVRNKAGSVLLLFKNTVSPPEPGL